MICEYAYTFTHIYTSTWHLPIGARDGHIVTLSNAINANCSSKAELKLFAGRGTKGLLCHIYICVYIYMCVCSKITKLFWSNPPSLLEQNIALEQQSITFGAKPYFAATLHNFWSKSLFWCNSPSLLEQKLVLEQHSITFGAKACFGGTLPHFWSKILFWSNTPSLLEQKLVLEQLFWSKSLFWSNTPSLFEQKLLLEQHSITFGSKTCFGATLHNF